MIVPLSEEHKQNKKVTPYFGKPVTITQHLFIPGIGHLYRMNVLNHIGFTEKRLVKPDIFRKGEVSFKGDWNKYIEEVRNVH